MGRVVHHVTVAHRQEHGPPQKILNTVAPRVLVQLHKVERVIQIRVPLIVKVGGVIMVRVMHHVVVVHKQEHGPLQLQLLMAALRVLVQLHKVESVIQIHVPLIV